MKFAIGSMSVGDILDRSVKLLFARFGTFYAINFVAYLPMLLFGLATPEILKSFGPQGVIAVAVLAMILNLILSPVAMGASLYVVSNEFVDKRVGFSEAIGFAFTRLGALLITGLMVGLVVGIGFMLCVLPGIIFIGWYAVAYPVATLERKSGSAAMSRSKKLVAGHRGRAFGLLFLVYIVLPFILGAGVGAITATSLPPYEMVPIKAGARLDPMQLQGIMGKVNWLNLIIGESLKFLVTMLSSAFGAIAITLLYFDLRIRKEGYDLELAAAQMDSAEPAIDLES